MLTKHHSPAAARESLLLLGKVRVHLLCPHTRATSTRALGQLLLTAQLSATPHLIQQILLMMESYERKKKTWHGGVCVNNDICKWLGSHNRSSGTLCI